MAMYAKATVTAYYGYDEFEMGFYDPATNSFIGCLDDNSPYIESLRFYNQLYRNDLLDPEVKALQILRNSNRSSCTKSTSIAIKI